VAYVYVLRFNEGLQVFGINVPPSAIHLSAEAAGDEFELTVSIDGPARFFWLRKP